MGEASRIFEAETLANTLTPEEKVIRQKFVAEYMKDFNPVLACIRIGYTESWAQKFAVEFMREQYTLNLIQEARRKESSPLEDKDLAKEVKREVIAQLRKEMVYTGPGASQAARVAAAGKLAQLLEMEPAKKVDLQSNVRGGVMKVPGIAKAGEWEEAGRESQLKLINDVRVH
jgi:hypothetical protein